MRKIHLQMDGNQICSTWDSFDCLAVSPAGFGDTIGESVSDLIKNTQAYELNGIVSSIENAPFNNMELPAITQQLKAEIAAIADAIEGNYGDIDFVREQADKLRQLSAV